MATVTLHSTLQLERDTGINRQVLRGVISGLGLTTYAGLRNAICLDDEGRELLIEHLKQNGFMD